MNFRSFLVFSVVMGAIVAFAGTETLQRTSNLIRSNKFNLFHDALTDDLVPRSSSGAPIEEGGNLGVSSQSWGDLYIKTDSENIVLQGTSSGKNGVAGINLVVNGVIAETFGGSKTFDATEFPDNSDINPARFTNPSNTTSSTYIAIDSATLTTSGRPVEVQLVSAFTGSGINANLIVEPISGTTVLFSEDNGLDIKIESSLDGDLTGNLMTKIRGNQITVNSSNSHDLYIPSSTVSFIDEPSTSGSVTYTLYLRAAVGSGKVRAWANHSRLIAYEL